jgi:rhodanese-related sulfurtransferase
MKFHRQQSILFCCFMLAATSLSAQTWTELLPSIRQRFPKVHQLSTAQLSQWLSSSNRPAPLLIDTRAAEEYAVSHLPEAKHADSVREIQSLITSHRQPVVLYCSVGYRSSDLATKLIKKGVTNVFNLEGSIFAWANEGRPVFRGQREVKDVHPYDEKWGQLLTVPYRTFKPR